MKVDRCFPKSLLARTPALERALLPEMERQSFSPYTSSLSSAVLLTLSVDCQASWS